MRAGMVMAGMVVAVVAIVVVSALDARAASAAPGPCADVNGVTVVVDFGAFGGGVEVRCAPGNPATGLAALQAAGFSVEGAARMPSFLCRIDGLPGVERDRCVVPSPPNAYWSYWVADRGRAWCYSDSGMNRRPVRGTVEGWSFAIGSAAAPRSSTFSALPGAGTTGRNCDTTASTGAPPPTAPPSPRPPTGGASPGPAPQSGVPPARSPSGASPGVGSPGGAAAGGGGGAVAPGPGSPGSPGDAGEPRPGQAPEEVAGATTSSGAPTTDPKASKPGAADGDGGSDDGASGDPNVTEQRDRRGTRGSSEEALSTIRSPDSGRSGPGSPLGSGVAVGTITALGAAAVVVNRRRFRSVTVPDAAIADRPEQS